MSKDKKIAHLKWKGGVGKTLVTTHIAWDIPADWPRTAVQLKTTSHSGSHLGIEDTFKGFQEAAKGFQEAADSGLLPSPDEFEQLLQSANAASDDFTRQQQSVPPGTAEFLLTMLASTRRADAMIGDLNERFTRERRDFGRDRAVRLYWARTLRSLPFLVWRAIGKVVVAVVKRFFGPTAA